MAADNIELDNLVAGDDVATDLITNRHYQQVKLIDGTIGDETAIASGGGVEAGALRVTIANDSTGTLTVDNAGTFAVQADLGANNDVTVQGEDAENAAAAANPVQVGGRYDATPRTLGDGDVGGIALDADGAVHISDGGNTVTVDGTVAVTGVATAANQLPDGHNVTIDNASGASAVNIQDGGNSITVDGTVTANPASGTIDTVTNLAQMGGVAITRGNGVSGTGVQRVTIASDSTGQVTLAAGTAEIGKLAAGTAAIGKLAANDGVDIGDVDVASITGVTFSNAAMQMTGDEAHDAADAGNPVKIGGKAKSFDGTAPGTDAAENDRVDAAFTVWGSQYVETAHPNHWSTSADYASAQTNATVKAAPGAGLKLYITDVIVSNGATAGNITLLDGSGGTVKLELYPAINGGLTHSFRTPIALTANTLLAITSTTVTTHSVTVTGYTAA